MQAIVYRRYGGPEVLEHVEVERPAPGDDQVLVSVRAVGLNPYDSHFLRGDPYIARPMLGLGLRKPRRATTPGSDVAGVVDSVGKNVTKFRPGDEVYCSAGLGGLAELVAVAEKQTAAKPANLTFEEAAAVPIAGTTALQAIRNSAALQPGQKVIVNGASGGVGSFGVQIAKALGAAEVTGVCSARNVDLVRSLGADEVIDYTRDDFSQSGRAFDVVLDTVGNRSVRALARVVQPRGAIIIIGGGGGRVIGPVGQLVRARLQSRFMKQRVVTMIAHSNGSDLDRLRELIEAGKVKPAIDRVFGFGKAAEAFRLLETHHARGKVVVAVKPE